MTDWKPTDDQMNLLIYPTWESIKTELADLQSELGCPDDYIAGMLENITYDWKEGSNG